MPVAETELVYKNPYQLLVAVILSAQCTDKRVNMVTPELFKAFPTAKKLSETEPEEVFRPGSLGTGRYQAGQGSVRAGIQALYRRERQSERRSFLQRSPEPASYPRGYRAG